MVESPNQEDHQSENAAFSSNSKKYCSQYLGMKEEIYRGRNKCYGTSAKHFSLRLEADKRYTQNAERMQMKYCKSKRKSVQTFNVGDFVSIKVPRIDRTSTDLHRLPCIVVQRLGSKHFLYRLR